MDDYVDGFIPEHPMAGRKRDSLSGREMDRALTRLTPEQREVRHQLHGGKPHFTVEEANWEKILDQLHRLHRGKSSAN